MENYFSEQPYHFSFPSEMHKIPGCSISSPILGIITFFLKFFKVIFNSSIIALRYYVGFCHTTWISHSTHMSPPSWSPLPSTPDSTPRGCHRAPDWALCVIQQCPTSCLFYPCSLFLMLVYNWVCSNIYYAALFCIFLMTKYLEHYFLPILDI